MSYYAMKCFLLLYALLTRVLLKTHVTFANDYY
jgi:1,4-dihydroxy-2-naphthoate octaprenyltransferase